MTKTVKTKSQTSWFTVQHDFSILVAALSKGNKLKIKLKEFMAILLCASYSAKCNDNTGDGNNV
jgi:hypothetical protein